MSTMVDYLNRPSSTMFNSSVNVNFLTVCDDTAVTIKQNYYHNGSGILPVAGDVCKDGNGDFLAAGYYRVGTLAQNKYIRIMSSVGVVQGLNDCA